MSLWRKRNVHHNGQNQPKWFNMTALANNDLSIKLKEHMTQDEIIELAKKYCSGYEFENGDVYDCYKFSKEELIAFAQLIAEKGYV